MPPLGLSVTENFLTLEQEVEIIQWLDTQTWSTKLARRTQHYGYEYDYQSRNAAVAAPVISGPLKTIADHLSHNNIMTPTQCIVNEYTRNQGISPHIDSPTFGPVIVGVCLREPCIMKFTRGNEEYDCWLPRRCIYVMTGESRYNWKHSISPNVTYVHDGQNIRKSDNYRRISLTYRTLQN